MIKPANNRTLWVYYDGQCPFCSRYMQLYRLRQGDKELVLINVRNDVATLAEFTAMGLDIDNGMVVQLDDIRYTGAKAMEVLALVSSPSNYFNRINRWVFSKPQLAKLLYPILVACRNLTLLLLGRSKINP
ncbi:MAG: putative DCC family thiol-disulfide oxidoreductase YuxK [Granulosicoccus sp.]|jgi:predicted DCC family thiol-disulfide oxidoreductase YuxK